MTALPQVLPAVLRTLYLAAFPGQAVLRAAVAAAVRGRAQGDGAPGSALLQMQRSLDSSECEDFRERQGLGVGKPALSLCESRCTRRRGPPWSRRCSSSR